MHIIDVRTNKKAIPNNTKYHSFKKSGILHLEICWYSILLPSFTFSQVQHLRTQHKYVGYCAAFVKRYSNLSAENIRLQKRLQPHCLSLQMRNLQSTKQCFLQQHRAPRPNCLLHTFCIAYLQCR